MSKNERLSILRLHLGLTTRAFGATLNMTGGAITNMEKGRRDIKDRTIKDICREYGVNQDWLENGIEPMFDDVFDGLDISEDVKRLSEDYSRLSETDKYLVKNLMHSLADKYKTQKQLEQKED